MRPVCHRFKFRWRHWGNGLYHKSFGGKPPRSNMNLDDWLHSAPSADVYVVGFQEIVPLNAGNILGAEDNGPAKKWLSLIKRTLDNAPGTSGGGVTTHHPPSLILWPSGIQISRDLLGIKLQHSCPVDHFKHHSAGIWRMRCQFHNLALTGNPVLVTLVQM